MATSAVLAIDQGTTNSKAVLFGPDGSVVARGVAPLPIYYPRPGWVEQDPSELWASVVQAVASCLGAAGEIDVVGVGLSNQRESVLAWHATTGRPLGPLVSWQCRRTAALCDRLRAEGHERAVVARTGLPLDPMFPATKVAWLLEHVRETWPLLAHGDVRVGTVDSWLLWRLTGTRRHLCDESNAARTQLFNLAEGRWDEQLGDLFGVPLAVMPDALPSDAAFGVTAGVPGLRDGIPVRAVLGDSHAALFGHGVRGPGTVKATYGTGSSLMTPLAGFVAPEGGVTTTIAWSRNGERTYALEGNILVSGAALPWAAKLLGLNGDVAALSALAETVPDTGGVFFVPALVGLGAPYWDSSATGLFTGLSFNSGPAQLARAVLEALTFQIADVLAAMQAQAPRRFEHLLADGGASGNALLMQLQADHAGLRVVTTDVPEASARGAALMAGLALGFWSGPEGAPALPEARTPRLPEVSEPERERRRSGWHRAVARARFRAA